MFVRDNPSSTTSSVYWNLQDKLIVDDGNGGVYGGYLAAIDDDTAIVAAVRLPCSDYRLRVFIFVRDSGTGSWSQQAMLHVDDVYQDDDRGPRVDIQGDTGEHFGFNHC